MSSATTRPFFYGKYEARTSKLSLTEPECQVPIMATDPEGGLRRIALVECGSTTVKRGKSIGTEDDPERDATARLFAAAPNLFEAARSVVQAANLGADEDSYVEIERDVLQRLSDAVTEAIKQS